MDDNIINPLRDLELKRIQAEIERNNAERKKIERDLKLFHPHSLFRIFISAILTVPLMWFYLEKIAIPAFQAENIHLKWENENILKKNREILDSTKIAVDSLNKLIADYKLLSTSLQKQILSLQQIVKSILIENSNLINKISKLSNDTLLTSKERDYYKKMNDGLITQKRKLESTVQDLNIKTLGSELAGWQEGRRINSFRAIGFYPNPFTDSTKFYYILPEEDFVTINILDSVGENIVKRLYTKEFQKEGSWDVFWDGKDDDGHNLPEGKYVGHVQLGPAELEKFIIRKNKK